MMLNIPESAPAFMPFAEISEDICPEIESVDIGEKLSGMFTYEVTAKDEHGVEIKIKSMTINPKKRIS